MGLSHQELLSRLREVDEYDFEHLVADVWEQRGWKTTVTTGSSDRGIDVIVKKSSPFSQKHLIQAKRYSAGNKIGGPDIQQYSSLRHQENDVDAVVVVTTSSFSSQARQRASELNVKLINGKDLCDIILGLDSQNFLSNYFNTEVETETKSTDPTSNADEQSGSTSNTSKSISFPKHSNIPDRYDKIGKSGKLGKYCPMCGGRESIWKVESVNSGELLICKRCDTKWKKKTGIIASTKWTVIGGDMKKTASKWKDMEPNNRTDAGNRDIN